MLELAYIAYTYKKKKIDNKMSAISEKLGGEYFVVCHKTIFGTKTQKKGRQMNGLIDK